MSSGQINATNNLIADSIGVGARVATGGLVENGNVITRNAGGGSVREHRRRIGRGQPDHP